jgi:hypothetical protein
MSDQEKRIRELEEQIPLAASTAFAQAHQQALLSGQTLVQTSSGSAGYGLYEIHPDGTRKLLKQLTPPLPVTPGTRMKIR